MVEKAGVLCAALMTIGTFCGWVWVRILSPARRLITRGEVVIEHLLQLPETRDRLDDLEADGADTADFAAAIARELGLALPRPRAHRKLLEAVRAARARAAASH